VEGVPAKCPTCSTAIPEGALRCPGCGRVFGEDNRCPHCHAIAAVKPRGDGFVCVACGKPREHLPLTTVLGDEDSRVSRASLVPAGAPVAKAATSGLRAFGVLGIGAGVLGAALATLALGTTPAGLIVAIAIALAGVGVGASSLRRAAARDQAQSDRERRGLELRITALAEKNAGDLTATVVAKALRITTEEADAALTRLADGTRVSLEVDENVGLVHYVFHEVQAALPKTRVATDAGESEAEGEREAEAAAKPEKKARRL
jgi:hypothetical protein